MKIKTLFTVTSVISVFYFINLFFMPAKYLEMRGLAGDEAAVFMTRLLSMAAVALMAFGWYSRRIQSQADITGMARSFCAVFGIGSIVLLMAKLNIPSLNGIGWADVLVSVILCLAYAYYLITKPKAA